MVLNSMDIYNMTGGYDPFFYDAMWSMLYGLKEVSLIVL